MTILETRGISKTYIAGNRRITVLDMVSIAVADGEFLVVQGESGSGKSTLLSVLAVLDSTDRGSVLIENRDIALSMKTNSRRSGTPISASSFSRSTSSLP